MKRKLSELPIRTGRGKHLCCVCLRDIATGNRYHDGGYYRRAHLQCVKLPEKSHKEQDEAINAICIAIAKRVMTEKQAPKNVVLGTCRQCGGKNFRYVGTDMKLCLKCRHTKRHHA